MDALPERCQGQGGHLEMLHAEGYADDRDAQQEPEAQVRKADPDASDEDPDDVHDERQASPAVALVHDTATEGPQRQYRQFQGLQPEGYADDRYHHHQAGYQILDTRQDPPAE